MDDEKPKIFVDEDWKSKVAREREEAEKAAQEKEKLETSDQPQAEAAEAPEGTAFMHHVSDLATQTMFSLGLIAPEGTEEVMVDLPQAKYLVDALVMLRDKTEGNLEAKEKGHLNEAIAELQRMFSVRAQQVQEASLQNAGINPGNLKGNPER